MTSPLFGIVADDLTGAMDSAGAMATHGLSAEVLLKGDLDLSRTTPDVVCINTQSRLMSERQAVRAVTGATRRLLSLGCARLYKKIDSTLRGHVGAELTATLQTAGKTRAFVCPAFPEMGRTTRGGLLHVEGQALTVTREGNDPFSAVGEASVVRLLQQQTGYNIGLVPLEDVEQGGDAVVARVETLLAGGCNLVVMDATSREHMFTLASALGNSYSKDLVAGSAGMASALAEVWKKETADTGRQAMTRPAGSFVIISGSLHPASYEQVQQLSRSSSVKLVPVSAEAVLQSPHRVALTTVRDAADAVAGGHDVALYWQDPKSLQALLQGAPFTRVSVQAIAGFFGSVLAGLILQQDLAGLVVVGGETAQMVVKAVGATSIELLGEVRPGIPVGRLVGGLADGKLLVTKAGGFGGPSALAEVIEYLRSVPQSEA
ncbi:MAG: four-carbon acid sugar kinase family protein [Chloroflexi bacterium]|nr:four-carbon acid sugar kinase family protein [Chloroflexota bacterium]